MTNNKAIAIIGPTASGKTGLGVRLAYVFDGEIVSADSRQVYRGMDIGTGKDLDEYNLKVKNKIVKIPYHLIDVVSPRSHFDLAKYQKKAFIAIDDILKRKKLPIVVGGSGLYVQALVDNFNLSQSGIDKNLRKKLEEKTVDFLYKKLSKINKKFAENLNNSEKNNKRRLIRYIEILKNGNDFGKNKSKYKFLLLGITWPRDILRKRIYKRLIQRIKKENMIEEVENLHKQGVSWKRLLEFGLEYKYITMYLRGDLQKEEMIEKLNIAIGQFAKRQCSWFRRWEKQGAKIHWAKNYQEAKKISRNFLTN